MPPPAAVLLRLSRCCEVVGVPMLHDCALFVVAQLRHFCQRAVAPGLSLRCCAFLPLRCRVLLCCCAVAPHRGFALHVSLCAQLRHVWLLRWHACARDAWLRQLNSALGEGACRSSAVAPVFCVRSDCRVELLRRVFAQSQVGRVVLGAGCDDSRCVGLYSDVLSAGSACRGRC